MILASATQQDLYRYSVENGYNGSWQEFSGFSTVPDPTTGFARKIPSSGSLLILEFGKDIQLTEDYYSAGSLGNFNLQLNLQVYNQFPYDISPEIVLITINSGVFVNERGTLTQMECKNDWKQIVSPIFHNNTFFDCVPCCA